MESFSTYLVKRLVALGYEGKAVPEAESLRSHCDHLLTYSDGMTFKMICILDNEAQKGKGFQMPLESLKEIGKICLEKYSGKINSTKIPIQIQIIEVGKSANAEEDKKRLQSLRSGMFSKVLISSWMVDTSTTLVWTNAPPNIPRFTFRRFLQKSMSEPRLTDNELFKPKAIICENTSPPLLTYFMLVVLVGVFILEQIFTIDEPTNALLAPGTKTLLAMGASSHDLVLDSKEWYRLFTAVFLHADLFHLIMNGIAFYFAGIVLEVLVGRAWFFTLFIIGGLGGSLLSVTINPPNILSVGASGAIMGMMAAAYVFSFRIPKGAAQMQIQMRLMGVLIPSLLPFANNLRQHVDISAHLGGAISGTLAGLLIYKAWPRDNPLPRFMGFAQGFALVGLAVYLVAAYMPVRDYGRTSHLMGMLIPGGQLPKSNEEGASHSVELVIRYPHDPLTHYYRAIALSKTNHIEDAEKELRLALNEKEIIDSFFDKKFEFAIRGMLAGCLLDEKRFQEAKEIVVPICEGDPDGELAKILKKEGLCR